MHNIEPTKKYPISVSFPKGLDAVSIVQPLINAKSGLFIMEIWKDIPGYESCYQASNLGRIKSLTRYVRHSKGGKMFHRGRILKPGISYRGYPVVNLSNSRTKYIHRLIASTFILNPGKKPSINHKNGIKTDNRIENLEWCTNKENTIHAIKNGYYLKGENIPNSKLTEKQVIEIRNKYIPYKYSAQKLANEYKMSAATISEIISNKIWKHIL
ncbi:hypothetical protein LCGC14_1851380 [marine sediment metagenome]|uniref:HNH nuclease domain-containing protein n=1 Tax=marine sediment metagenome TaxID=412755 RepID=A0A0F9J9L9_9ZZZZ